MRRFKLPFPLIALGVCVLVAMLIGANRLTDGSGNPSPGAGGNPAAAKTADGLVTKGRVDTEFSVVAIHLPAHLQAGRVIKILVKDAQPVKKGDPLVQFDAAQFEHDVKTADATLGYATQKYQEATKGREQHAKAMEKADVGIRNAEQQRDKAKEARDATRKNLEPRIKANRQLDGAAVDIEKELHQDPDFLKADAAVTAAENQVSSAKIDKELLALQPVEVLINEAFYKVEEAKAAVAKAKWAVENCELKADVPGVIEHVAATQGQVVYPQSPPLCYLVPDGPRFVKAEIAPDFAYKIRDRDGGKVIVSDDSNPGLTYEGTVEQIGSAFLPKAGGVDLLNGKATYILEVRIRVTDPAPAGKPPLRVNQPVRVLFP